MFGGVFTVTFIVSELTPGDCAVKVVVHGNVADPPYVTVASALMRPVGMVTGPFVVTHAGLPATNVTSTPGAGAATGEPALSSRTVMVAGNAGRIWTEVWMMFSAAVVAT